MFSGWESRMGLQCSSSPCKIKNCPAQLLNVLQDIHVAEKPIYNYVNLETNSTLHISSKIVPHSFDIC